MDNHRAKAMQMITVLEFEDGSINIYSHEGGDSLSDEGLMVALSSFIADVSKRMMQRSQA